MKNKAKPVRTHSQESEPKVMINNGVIRKSNQFQNDNVVQSQDQQELKETINVNLQSSVSGIEHKSTSISSNPLRSRNTKDTNSAVDKNENIGKANVVLPFFATQSSTINDQDSTSDDSSKFNEQSQTKDKSNTSTGKVTNTVGKVKTSISDSKTVHKSAIEDEKKTEPSSPISTKSTTFDVSFWSIDVIIFLNEH